ncbi:hypothetical protein L838_5282 [Mycobacterium avium MAV_120709_2344]|nr:hypothetical protein L839_4609 [Mycobacterium avium MAV_120809_2495]ETZ41001.1 hypothetical protein L838_5282 [Mycobacterium avium MAV_120709_2344]ETZ72568.1 hypothetical protein L841_0758 [Mycobacterium sp. MAC_080597_8934]
MKHTTGGGLDSMCRAVAWEAGRCSTVEVFSVHAPRRN